MKPIDPDQVCPDCGEDFVGRYVDHALATLRIAKAHGYEPAIVRTPGFPGFCDVAPPKSCWPAGSGVRFTRVEWNDLFFSLSTWYIKAVGIPVDVYPMIRRWLDRLMYDQESMALLRAIRDNFGDRTIGLVSLDAQDDRIILERADSIADLFDLPKFWR
jgi:hypothetical protein